MRGAIAGVAGVLLAMLLPGVAGANSVPSQVSIDSNALLVQELDTAASSFINVQLSVQCAGVATVTVTVQQPVPGQANPNTVGNATGTGTLTFQCSKSAQRIAVSIEGAGTPGFNLGDALANASITATEWGFMQPDKASDQKIISIRYR
jgi:hypothetical protein